MKLVLRNSAFLFSANIINAALFFALVILIARLLGPEELGLYSFAMAIAVIVAAITELGLDQLLTREIARKKELAAKYYRHASALRAVVSIATVLVIGIVAYLSGLGEETLILVWAASIYAVLRTNSFTVKSVFRAYEKMELEAIPTILGAITVIAGSVIALELGMGLVGVGAALILGGTMDLVASLVIMTFNGVSTKRKEIKLGFIKELFFEAMPFWLMTIIVAIFFSTDIFMLLFLLGEEAVGFYSAAFKPLAATVAIAGPIVISLYPSLSKHYTKSKIEVKKLFKNSLKLLLGISIPITITTILFADQITNLIYGTGFEPTTQIFQVLSVLPILLFVNMLLAITMNAMDQQKANMINALIITSLNIVLNLVLINSLGLIGAAYATIASQILFLVLSFKAINNQI